MSSDKIVTYEGAKAKVCWDGRLCIHIGECGRADNSLFVGDREPWCVPDTVSVDTVVDVIERCPSGALTYHRKDGGADEIAVVENTVHVIYNGPLYVRGDLKIDGAASDMDGVRFRAALCRCGHSKSKPFCDNSHEKAGFKDSGAVGETGDGLKARGGKLTINRTPDGPLVFAGNFTIVAGSGRRAWAGQKATLCRCGHSQNKPFCDGSHTKAGFKAD